MNLWQAVPPSWQTAIGAEQNKPYIRALQTFLQTEAQTGQMVFPAAPDIFRALQETPFDDVKVVILGQDPYHGAGQAHGLAFSVPQGIKPPPSLVNIYKELARSYGTVRPAHGDLSSWARQGVLLLNATLTVRESAAGSHQRKGWEDFTDALIRAVNDRHDHVVFMLWGSYAQKKGAFIDRARHLVLEAPHPSPLSAHRGFIGCGHFEQANASLTQNGKTPVEWVTGL